MKFLVFQHVPHEHPGLISKYAQKRGIELNIVELWKPHTLPDPANFDGLIIMGGPMGVYEDKDAFPSKDDEVNYITSVLGNMPIIGFCLGSQLLAYTLGARVYPNEKNGKKVKEIGFYDVTLTKEGLADPIFQGFDSPMKVLQLHGDAFDLPSGATLLATSPNCTNQAFRYGDNAYGMLFHIEFTPEMIATLIEIDREWIHDGFDLNEEQFKKQADEYKDLMQTKCYRLFDNFLLLMKN